jgi:hypothetical protein
MALRSERRFISQVAVKSGMLVEFTYRKMRDSTAKTYMAMVVDPNKNNYLHALLVDDLSDVDLIRLVVTLGNLTFDPSNRAQPLTDLKSDEAYKKYSGIKDQRRYRTFLLSNISGLRQILIGDIT